MVDMLEQSRLVNEVARSLVAVAPEGWTALHYRTFMVRGQQQARLMFDLPEGPKGVFENNETMAYMRELRSAMYTPGKGTFFTAYFDITAADGAVQTRFEYDEEPDFWVGYYSWARDFEAFPRDAQHTPEWLRQSVALGPLEEVGYALFAKMPGEDGIIEGEPLPDNLGLLLVRASRGGGKLFIAYDKSLMFSPPAESVEQGLERFRAGDRWEPTPAE